MWWLTLAALASCAWENISDPDLDYKGFHDGEIVDYTNSRGYVSEGRVSLQVECTEDSDVYLEYDPTYLNTFRLHYNKSGCVSVDQLQKLVRGENRTPDENRI